jgi:hypothetical protein
MSWYIYKWATKDNMITREHMVIGIIEVKK